MTDHFGGQERAAELEEVLHTLSLGGTKGEPFPGGRHGNTKERAKTLTC